MRYKCGDVSLQESRPVALSSRGEEQFRTVNMNAENPALLRGTKIVSVALNAPGPAAAARLTQLGAEVTKIEPPEGDATSKFALEGLSEALSEEVRPFGVSVSLVEPGFVNTPIISQPPTNPIAAYIPGRQAAQQSLLKGTKNGMEPGAVARVILRAATTRPRLRYLVGRDAKVLMLLKRLLPEPLFERVRRRVFRTGNPADQEPQRGPQETATS